MSNSPWNDLLESLEYLARRSIELNRRMSEWYVKAEPTVRRVAEMAYRGIEAFPIRLALTSVTFSRGGWSEVPLGDMDLSEFSELVERLRDKSNEDVKRELDEAILEYFRRDSYAPLSEMVAGLRAHFEERYHIFEDALWAHKQCRYTLSIPALATQVEGVLRDLTEEHGRGRAWINRFNNAFEFEYDPSNPPPPPDVEEVIAEFRTLSTGERYLRMEELRTRFMLLHINELYDNGEFSDPEFSSSVNRHAILHGVFLNYGELQSLRLFFVLALLHEAVSAYKKLSTS